jgi:hypothetical protein
MREDEKKMGDLFSLDGSRKARDEEEYQRLLRLQKYERSLIAALLWGDDDPTGGLLKPLPEQQQ